MHPRRQLRQFSIVQRGDRVLYLFRVFARPFRLEGVLDAKNRAPREALRKPSRLARKVLYRIPGQAPLHQIPQDAFPNGGPSR